MQVKNASFFQLHIEKIVLAVGVLFLLIAIAVVVFGVVLKPYQVKLGNQTYDKPAQIFPVLEQKAQVLDRGLQATNLEQPAEVPEGYMVPDLETNYRQMLEQPIVEPQTFASLGSSGMQLADIELEQPAPPSYTLPSPPMVEDIEYKHGFEVLSTEDRALSNAYFEMWDGERDPADFSYVFIEGTFDMLEWIERLQAEPTQGQRVPLGIWNQKLGLATVVLIRERRDPLTGEWTDRTVVPMLPDQVGVMPDQEHPRNAEPSAYIEWYLSLQPEIAQPAPPPLAGGGELLPPLDDPMLQIDPEELERMAEEERAAERARRRAEMEQRQAQRAAEREARRNERGGRGGSSGPGGEFGPGAPPASGPGGVGGPGGRGELEIPGRPSGSRTPSRPGRQTPAGGLGEEFPGQGTPAGGRFDSGLDGTGADELEEGQLRVWAIDVTVQPGTVYRYKLVAGVINPLYGVARLEEAQLSENLNRAALLPTDEDIEQTPWIEPIEIEPSNQFYVVSANDRGARINVWRVHNGERVKETFDVNPGDPIGGAVQIEGEDGIEHNVDMSVGATVVDIDRRKDINGATLWTLIYIDDYGKLHERSLAEDQSASNQFERRLREEREARERALEMMPGNSGPGSYPGPGGIDEFGPGGGFPPAGLPGRTGR